VLLFTIQIEAEYESEFGFGSEYKPEFELASALEMRAYMDKHLNMNLKFEYESELGFHIGLTFGFNTCVHT